MMNQTRKRIYALIASIRECQTAGVAAIDCVGHRKHKYTEVQALFIARQKFMEIGNLLGEYEKSLIEEKNQQVKENDIWND